MSSVVEAEVVLVEVAGVVVVAEVHCKTEQVQSTQNICRNWLPKNVWVVVIFILSNILSK